jgi:hypothetical protein
MEQAGLHRDPIYLVRPDGYVAMASRDAGARPIAAFLDRRRLASTMRKS